MHDDANDTNDKQHNLMDPNHLLNDLLMRRPSLKCLHWKKKLPETFDSVNEVEVLVPRSSIVSDHRDESFDDIVK